MTVMHSEELGCSHQTRQRKESRGCLGEVWWQRLDSVGSSTAQHHPEIGCLYNLTLNQITMSNVEAVLPIHFWCPFIWHKHDMQSLSLCTVSIDRTHIFCIASTSSVFHIFFHFKVTSFQSCMFFLLYGKHTHTHFEEHWDSNKIGPH